MTKNTILAGLGVVAALGTAALPLASYATEPSVSGNVDLFVEVLPAIAMTITGNNDNGANSYTFDPAHTYAAVDNYDHDGGTTATETGTVDGHTSAHVTGYSSSYASILPNSVVEGGTTTGAENFKSTITVYTNNAAGYDLTVADADTDTDLDLETPSNEATEKIPTGATLTAGTAAWAIKTTGLNSNAWTAMVASDAANPLTVHTQDTKTSGGQQSVVYYGVSTKSDQATGLYGDTIVYTATVK